MSKEKLLRYSIGIKSRGGGYSSVVKDFTREQFEAYYDKTVTGGGKIVAVMESKIS